MGNNLNFIPGEKLIDTLRNLAATHDLRRRAEEGCRQWLTTWAAEEGGLDGLSIDEIEVHFEKCYLAFEHGVLSYPFIETRFGLFVRDSRQIYFRDLRPVGHYRFITLLDGTVSDDYFVIDTETPHRDSFER